MHVPVRARVGSPSEVQTAGALTLGTASSPPPLGTAPAVFDGSSPQAAPVPLDSGPDLRRRRSRTTQSLGVRGLTP
jgi:hypothetical protein